ncbi:MAG: trypsin-like peptidase domain-containing protein [Thaumarchaeota archaeon]|nr:trypsin-like peptidase domain-containing protein [Nitrososphaerota archaeon]MDE1840365.1 trypsin-like peptidase domain-containing protein [Nitrososphaerota archaeon]MDE1878037.1 trypsin-like peptidase domain-containing protein [Nitrososphaerota archaeon]
MDKTTAILGGAYGIIVLVIVLAFVFEQQKTDPTQQTSILESLVQSPGSQLSLADLFAKSQDGVVQIIVRKTGDNSSSRAIGSGIVYDLGGHIITSNHVVADYQKIRVVFHDGKSYSANVSGTDVYADLAVIKVNADSQSLHPLPLGDSSKLRIGDTVTAIGSPFGLSGSMTSGIVSQLGRILNPPNLQSFSIPNVIQTDAAINPGNSGGPLLNDHGEVIGINTAIQTDTGEFSGVGFAIPSNTMKRIVPALIQSGHYKHPWLGISGITLDPDLADSLGLATHSGFLIENIVSDSPASKAGLHASNQTKTIDGIKYKYGGDIIVGVDNNPVLKLEDLLNYLQDNKSAGDKMVVHIIRDGKKMDVTLTLQERPYSQ